MSVSGSLSKPQVYSKSGALAPEDFETLWKTVKDYLCTLPDNSPLVRGPNFGSAPRTDSAAFTRDLNDYFAHGNFGGLYWTAGSGTEFTYPADQKEVMSFFRIMIVTMGGSIRQNRKRTNKRRAQRIQTRETQQAENSQPQVSVRAESADTPIANLPKQNIHSRYITNPDECDDRSFEAGLGDEEPRAFLVSPLSIKFDEFFHRFCECWEIDVDTVNMHNLGIRVSLEGVSEYFLSPSNLSSAWRDVMKVAKTSPDSSIKIVMQVHGYTN